jgi:hypothetical protein
VNFQRASTPLPTRFQPLPTGVRTLPHTPWALERAPSWKRRSNARPEGQTRKRKEFLMSDSSDPEANPFILQARCEMARRGLTPDSPMTRCGGSSRRYWGVLVRAAKLP